MTTRKVQRATDVPPDRRIADRAITGEAAVRVERTVHWSSPMSSWDRIESMGRSTDFSEGVQARVADPLWMLGRQWQVGEFRGDDAAPPAAVRMVAAVAPLRTYRPSGADQAEPLPGDVPLERLVEDAPVVRQGTAGFHAAASAGRRLMRMLRAAGLDDAADLLSEAFPLAPPADLAALGPRARVALRLLARRGVDGAEVLAAGPPRLGRVFAALPAGRGEAVRDVFANWRARYQRRDGRAWLPERLEHRFSVAAATDLGEVVLAAAEHHGGHLDWYGFDVAADEPSHGLGAAKPDVRNATTIPVPVHYSGMPASRWWEFEDGAVHFGDIGAGPGDLARLAVAEFAVAYSDDWFVVPLRMPTGSLARVVELKAVDAFGGRTVIEPAGVVDRRRAPGLTRAWRLYELDGDRHVEEERAPWLLLPPALASSMSGPPIERVELARDEGANLAWAVERLVEGPLGRAVDRARAWFAANPAVPPGTDTEPISYAEMSWRYELESEAPPWWIPLVPERTAPGSPQVHLRRARMRAWELIDRVHAGPKGTLLEPARPFTLYEEEVPRGGATVERTWQFARWQDGSVHVWMQRRKRAGRGERSSGLRWDFLTET